MAKINISDAKIKALANTIYNSKFFIAGTGNFDLEQEEYEQFIRALMSDYPKIELNNLYYRIK